MFMLDKKVIINILIVLCFSSIVFCETMKIEPSKLNGTWMPNHSYLWKTSNPERKYDYPIHAFSWGKGKSIPNTSLEMDFSTSVYVDPGMFIYSIKEYQQLDNTTFKVQIYRQVFDDIPESLDEKEVIIHFLNEDSFWIESKNYKTYDKDAAWYRLSGENSMSKAASINDDRVRIRVQPSLDCDTWGFLNKGEKVTVIDTSKDKQKIGNMENYWYKVDAQGYPDGWVYGEYITFE